MPRSDESENEEETKMRRVGDPGPHQRLLVFWGSGSAVHELPLQGSLSIGRSMKCDVRVDDESISRKHAVIHVNPLSVDGPLFIEDLGSANGTRIGGVPVPPNQRVPLATGTPVAIGDAMCLIQGGDEPVAKGTAQPPQRPAPVRHDSPEPRMDRLFKLIELVAKSAISVLLSGETGVGKEVIAERIHARSPRAKGPLLKLNCAALADSLLETELFGHERGAFTGAVQTKMGLLEAAEGGTVFLDELGDMPLGTQVKLLRAIENREVMRVGGLKSRPIDVRFVAATHRDLQALSASGEFRQDLYFRLNGISIEIPPLRERLEEIRPLVDAFLTDAATKSLSGKPTCSNEALLMLEGHPWPGNVRELRNVIDRAVMLSGGGTIEPEHIMLGRVHHHSGGPPPVAGTSSDRTAQSPVAERQRILDALARSGANQTEAAKLLGISRRTLVYRLSEYDIPRPRKRGDNG